MINLFSDNAVSLQASVRTQATANIAGRFPAKQRPRSLERVLVEQTGEPRQACRLREGLPDPSIPARPVLAGPRHPRDGLVCPYIFTFYCTFHALFVTFSPTFHALLILKCLFIA